MKREFKTYIAATSITVVKSFTLFFDITAFYIFESNNDILGEVFKEV